MTTPTRRHVLTTLLAASAVPLTACSGSTGAAGAGTARSPSTSTRGGVGWAAPRTLPDGWGSTAADGVFPRAVVHARGTTTVPAAPRRVAVLSTGQFDTVLALGPVPVGATRGEGAGLVPDYLADRATGEVADLGLRASPNLEAVAALAPDLILVNDSLDDGSVYDRLAELAPVVVTPATGVGWKQGLLLAGAALGTSTVATDLLDSHQADAEALGQAVPDDLAVSVLNRNGDRTRLWGVASFAGSILQDAGITRPASQQFDKTSQDLSEEQLGLVDGDHLFAAERGVEGLPTLSAAPLWPGLEVVQAGAVTVVAEEPWFLNAGPLAARHVLDDVRGALT